MRFSAIVCSYNRLHYVRRAIASLENQTLPTTELEIIAVDNGSTDGSVEFLEAESARLPNMRLVREPVLGLSEARNAGIEAATAPWVGFIDDDAVAVPEWAETILRVAAEEGDDVGAIGGRIEPIWEAPRPRWLHDMLLGYFSILDRGPDRFTMRGVEQIAFGTNMAFRADVLDVCGRFSAELGRKGTSLLSNEETLLQLAIDERGYRRIYDPDVKVGHPVHDVRLNKKWLLRRAWWQGASDAVMDLALEERSAPARVLRAASTLGWVAIRPRQIRAAILPTSDPVHMRRKAEVVRRIGYAAAMLRTTD